MAQLRVTVSIVTGQMWSQAHGSVLSLRSDFSLHGAS